MRQVTVQKEALEMSVDDEIVLDESSFAEYVMDDWDWQHQFLSDSSAYSLTARTKFST